jgi:hypothetical protein
MTIDIDESKLAHNEAGLWIGWTLATTLGLLFGTLPFLLLMDSLDLFLFRLLLPLWSGFLVGLFQWLVLRRYLTHCVDWILNGGAGWALGYALGLFVIQLLSQNPLSQLLGYLLFGLILAVVQWPVLRREMSNITPWILANMVAWALGAYISGAVFNLVIAGQSPHQIFSTTVISLITGLVAGGLTALALIWIVRKPEI